MLLKTINIYNKMNITLISDYKNCTLIIFII